MYTSVSDPVVKCIEIIWGRFADIVVRYVHMNQLAFVTLEWHIGLGTYMVITWFLSYNADVSISDTIAFVILRWLFRGIIWCLVPVPLPVMASVWSESSSTVDGTIACWRFRQFFKRYHMTFGANNGIVPGSVTHDVRAPSVAPFYSWGWDNYMEISPCFMESLLSLFKTFN